MTRCRALASLAGLIVGLLAVLVTPAGPASAHAALLQSDPQSGAVLPSLPVEAVLTFTEPVRIVPQKIHVIGPDGRKVDGGTPTTNGPQLHIPIKPTTERGTYLVSFRIISADSHPIAGAIPFSVGAPSANAPNATSNETPTDPLVTTLLGGSRYVGYAGLALLAGPALFLTLLWPRRLSRRGPLHVVRIGIGLIALSSLAEQYLQAPYHAGTGLFGASAADLQEVFNSQYGAAHLVRIGVLAALLVLLPVFVNRPPGADGRIGWTDRALVAILAIVGFATWPLSGHPAATSVPVITTLADVAHLGAMAVWIGGLVTLFGFVLRQANARELAAILPVWSRWATIAVAVLVTAGTAQALVSLGSPRGLYGTLYGRLLMIKVGILAVVLAVAWYSRRLALGRLREAGADDGDADDAGGVEPSRRRLRRTVVLEVAGTVVILGVTSALAQTTPARAALQQVASQESTPYLATLTSKLYSLQVQLEPRKTGANAVHLYAFGPGGAPVPVKEWHVTAALPAQGIEPVELPVLPIADNHAVAQALFPSAGTWELRFTLRTSEIDAATVVANVPIS
jgi:copper transport protein